MNKKPKDTFIFPEIFMLKERFWGHHVRVVIIDGCEYILFDDGIAHKGNCKFCIERGQIK